MHRFARLLATLLLALPVAGCGSDDVNPDAIAAAADKTASAKGVRMTGTIKTDVPGAGEIPMTMKGVADLAGKRARIEMDMSAAAATAGGQLDPDDMKIEAVMVGTTMYMAMPFLEKQLGAKWMKIDMQRALEGSGIDLAQLQQMSSMSPSDQLDFLRSTGDIEEVGDNHYKGTVDLRKVPGGGERLAKLSGATTFPVEVWIGDNGYIERYAMTMSQKVQGDTVKSRMEFRYSDYGTRVAVEAPTEGVKDMTELAKQGIEQQQR